MTGKFETRLAELGVTLADAPALRPIMCPSCRWGIWSLFLAKLAKTPMASSPANWETR